MASTTSAGRAELDDAQDGFRELLAALNPYVDELVHQPTFHHFLDLPVELRCLVHEQYFLDEKKSISCRNWPHLEFSQTFMDSIRHKRITASFLPNLCLTSKQLQGELFTCLLEAAHFEFANCNALGCVLLFLCSSAMPLRLPLTLRKLSLKNLNGQRKRLLFKAFNDLFLKESQELAQSGIECYTAVLPVFPRLRELTLEFYAPLMYMSRTWNGDEQDPVHALSIKDYLGRVRLEPILGLQELQRVTIIGISGNCNKSDLVTLHGIKIIDDGKADHLTPISLLGGQIKEGFKAQNRNVAVTACLQYAPDEHVEETFT
ncbi:hypothetical protein BDW02DRAFT_595661 [Decorospora gaudefroyi]|uniref:Uncharacterized protein n=1 Tax=Decorospora gaudefroyi TaxID=184978 RepID=A0A6A5KNM3_9PLEO|nr:hypothetical protein BDW02DRAFT_595661 [Decorospora gaudefroyi]